MKRKINLFIYFLFLATVLCGCGNSLSAEPSPKDFPTEALSAYREILKAAPAVEGQHEELADASFNYEQNQAKFGNHYDMFAFSDINHDGIPELIALTTVNFRWTPVSVFTYAEGNAVLLHDPSVPGAHATFEQNSSANGAYITFICSQNHIHSVWCGTNPIGDAVEENHAYLLEGTTLIETSCPVREGENTISFYDIAKRNTAENVDAGIEQFFQK